MNATRRLFKRRARYFILKNEMLLRRLMVFAVPVARQMFSRPHFTSYVPLSFYYSEWKSKTPSLTLYIISSSRLCATRAHIRIICPRAWNRVYVYIRKEEDEWERETHTACSRSERWGDKRDRKEKTHWCSLNTHPHQDAPAHSLYISLSPPCSAAAALFSSTSARARFTLSLSPPFVSRGSEIKRLPSVVYYPCTRSPLSLSLLCARVHALSFSRALAISLHRPRRSLARSGSSCFFF